MPLLSRAVLATLPYVPTPIMRRISARYIAGETLPEALARLIALQRQGFGGVLDILGEDVADAAAARAAVRAYCDGVDAIAREGIDAYVSVKPTHFGLRISSELAFELYSQLLEHCRGKGQFARVEMEDHTTTDATLALFTRLRSAGFDNVGIVLQSRLLRTPNDIAALPGGGVDVRMVKGIYLEPATIAHTEPAPIRDAFVAGVEALFQRGCTVAIATHDEELGERVLGVARRLGVPPERHYFEVLMGVQEPLWRCWRAAGHRVRVYVPFGPEWRPYSTRRLRKNPQILGHVMRNLLPWA